MVSHVSALHVLVPSKRRLIHIIKMKGQVNAIVDQRATYPACSKHVEHSWGEVEIINYQMEKWQEA